MFTLYWLLENTSKKFTICSFLLPGKGVGQFIASSLVWWLLVWEPAAGRHQLLWNIILIEFIRFWKFPIEFERPGLTSHCSSLVRKSLGTEAGQYNANSGQCFGYKTSPTFAKYCRSSSTFFMKTRMKNSPVEKWVSFTKRRNSMHMHYKATRNSFNIVSTVCKKIYALDVANLTGMKCSSRKTMRLHQSRHQ